MKTLYKPITSGRWRLLAVLIFLPVCIPLLRAQVTIGSEVLPVSGALLDLKQSQFDGNNANSTKGLGMPRVNLTDLSDITKDITNVTTANKNEHSGLLVYNVNGCAANDEGFIPGAGLYVWDGNVWQYIGETVRRVYEVVDDRDPAHPDIYQAGNFGVAGDWLLENVRYIAPGFIISANATNDTDKFYFYPQPDGGLETDPANIPTWKKKQGLLYTYSAATMGAQDTESANQEHGSPEGEPTLIQGVCPNGWHIPSDREWNELQKEIYNHPEKYSTYSGSHQFGYPSWDDTWNNDMHQGAGVVIDHNNIGHAIAMKSPCEKKQYYMGKEFINGNSYPVTRGGLNIELVGWASSGSALGYGQDTDFWTSSSMGTWGAYFRSIQKYYSTVFRNYGNRTAMRSIRCKRN